MRDQHMWNIIGAQLQRRLEEDYKELELESESNLGIAI